MSKRPGKTRAQPDEGAGHNPAGSGAIGTPIDDGLEALANSLAALDDPSGHEVLLYEIDDRGRRTVLCKIAPADFDPFSVAEEFGGGTYCAQVRESGDGKRIVTQRNFTVSTTVKGKRRDGVAARPAGDQAKPDQGVLGIALAMMQHAQTQATAMMAQQTQMLTALLTRPNELAGLLPALVTSKPAAGSDIGQLVSALKAIDEMRTGDGAAGVAAAGEGELSWLGPPLAALVQGFMTARAAAPAATPPQRPPAATMPAPPKRPAVAATTATSAARSPATAVLSNAVAGEERDEAAPIPYTREAVRSSIVARLVLGQAIDAPSLADQLAQTIDGASLDAFMASVPAGELTAVLLDGVPSELAAAVTGDQATMQAIADLERELRAIIEEADDETEEQDAGETAGQVQEAAT